MKVISELVEVRDNQLFIPWYHRVSPNLRSGSVANCLLIKKQVDNHEPILIFSQFPFESWGDLWLIELRVIDQIGVLHRISNTLKTAGVNILNTEVAPVHGNITSISLIADLTRYQDCYDIMDPATNQNSIRSIDKSSANRFKHPAPKIRNLEDCLTLELYRDINLVCGQPELQTRRLNELHAVKQSVSDENGLLEESVVVSNGTITFANVELWAEFSKNLAGEPGRKRFCLVTSDTQQGYLKITPVGSTRSYLTIAVRMKDEPGQLLRCSEALKQGCVNIRTAYETLQKAGGGVEEGATWRALLEFEGQFLRSNLVELVRDILNKSNFSGVTFPKPIAFENESKS